MENLSTNCEEKIDSISYVGNTSLNLINTNGHSGFSVGKHRLDQGNNLEYHISMCYHCGSSLPEGAIYRTTLCPDCDKALKTCHNCEFFAPGQQYDCRESISDPVNDKDSANFCDFFSKHPGPFDKKNGNNAASDARNKFNNLFGD